MKASKPPSAVRYFVALCQPVMLSLSKRLTKPCLISYTDSRAIDNDAGSKTAITTDTHKDRFIIVIVSAPWIFGA